VVKNPGGISLVTKGLVVPEAVKDSYSSKCKM
jgi:hypothetical protein